jgi:RNA polymerase sigma-70 factor (ECF subfamily)
MRLPFDDAPSGPGWGELRGTPSAHLADRAVERLLAENGPALLAAARRVVADRFAAEEAVEDTLVRVWRDPSRFDPLRGSLRSWLLTMVRSRAIDLRRARASVVRREQRVLQEQPPGPATSGTEPCEQAQRDEAAAQVRAALDLLPAAEAAVLRAAYFGGASHGQIARDLGLPLGTVKSRIRRGLGRLRLTLSAEPDRSAVRARGAGTPRCS